MVFHWLFLIIDTIANIIFSLLHYVIHFAYVILYALIMYCFHVIYTLICGFFHIVTFLFFNSLSHYFFIGISLFCILFVCAEIINKRRYKKFCDKIRREQRHANFSHNDDRLIKYSSFLKKHMINDNFLAIFKSFYPDPDEIMNKTKVHNAIKKYIYCINPSYNIDFSQHLTNSQISIVRTINQLTSKYEKMYMFITDQNQTIDHFTQQSRESSDESLDQSLDESSDQSQSSDQFQSSDIFSWENLSDIIFYQSSFTFFIKHFKYLNFVKTMRSHNYQYDDITSDIRVWTHQSLIPEDKIDVVNFIFLTSSQTQSIQNHQTIPSKSCVYIEIKGYTDFCALFDLITLDFYNDYSNLRTIARNLNKLFNMFVMADIHIYASDVTTMLIPFIVNYYQEMIHTIHVKDPIFYPYNYQTFFMNLRNDKELRKSVGCQYNLIMLLNELTLIDMYIDPEMCDKKTNMSYGPNTIVSFSDESDKFVDKNNLIMLLELYSGVIIDVNNKY